MRFVIAIVLFLLAFVSIGYGIAQRTILAGPSSLSASVTTTGDARITLVDGATLHSFPGTQGVMVSGASTLFVADGRTADVLAWVGTTTYNRVTFDATTQKLVSKIVSGKDTMAPSPVGSDLWDQEFTGTTELIRRINVPETATVIIMSDGTKPAPKSLSITWPLDNSAPWSGPLIIAGIGALLLGLGAFLWALVHARRRRGPRRKQPRLPRNPKPPQLKRGRLGTQPAIAAPSRGRRRNFIATSVLVSSALALTGCSAFGSLGGVTATPTPTSTSAVPGAADLQAVAVTDPQLTHIVSQVVKTVAVADAKGDAKLAATRLGGPALQLRVANYATRAADPTIAAVPALPNWPVKIALPQQSDTWPRSVFAVIQSPTDAKAAPIALMLVQDTPRDNYKAHYVMTLELDVPAVAPVTLGAARLLNDNKLGILTPAALAAAYGSILIQGDASTSNKLFSAIGDKLRTSVGYDYKQKQKADLPPTAAIAYANGPGPGQVIAFGTNDSGQIVAANLNDTETVTPTQPGAAINPSGAIKALLGKSETVKGVVATYGLQLLFYVPPVSRSNAKIQLLGFAQGLIAATEVP
ncbi:MAG: hypothetical protein HIU88_11115 [Acidobacteria bacterium]|nr:hypothetical protein [Acidobacteriota bacterium]